MATSMFTALTGLQSNQSWIDVIGNNLANSNTPGFKSSRVTFSDLFARNLSFASAPNGTLGGRNPTQIGYGVSVGDVAHSFDQGALTDTGRVFDLALKGGGFFALSNGALNLFTRVGTFGLDENSDLVDLATGYRVQSPGGDDVNLDVQSLFPPNATASVTYSGNLPGEVGGPLAETLLGASGLKHGLSAQLTGANAGPYTIPAGETWTLDVSVNGGAPQSVSIQGTGVPVTAADVAAAIDAVSDVSATVSSGAVVVTTDRTGAEVQLKIGPGEVGKDLAGLVGLSTTLVTGSETPLVPGTTTLNDLPGNVTDYADGDVLRVIGVDTDGTPIDASFQFGSTGAGYDGTTVDELIAFVDGLYADAEVSLNASGQIVVEAQTAGESELLLSISDEGGQVGRTDWNVYKTSVATQGTGPDTVTTSSEVYDRSGVAHTMTLTFERQADGSWTASPSLASGDGQVLSGPITGIRFADDGSPLGLAAVQSQITVQFPEQAGSQTLELDLGADGEFGGLTHFGSEPDVWASDQDGYAAGELASITVQGDGTIDGFYTNGQSRTLGAVGVAHFGNPEGLAEMGDNRWGRTANSGSYVLGAGDSGAAGEVVGGALENSNVDTAEEFVHLIEAQRGYQASARVISVQDEILSETVNLI